MPGMDGYELAERIRRISPKKQEVMLILSSSPSAADQERAQKLGIARRLTKPIRRIALRDAMLEALATDISGPREGLPEEQTANFAGIRILLVEDNRVNQELAMRLLKKMGHEVVLAVNGLEAVERVQRETFDLVLMDVQMPVMGGMEATRKIREWEKVQGSHVAIVAMTAHAMTGDAEKCIATGMDGYVSKPIRRDVLVSEIERVTDCKKKIEAKVT
jgi:two-component system sensor histidine kinase/response regulator